MRVNTINNLKESSTALSFLLQLSLVAADFHVGWKAGIDNNNQVEACPSNYYNCNCFFFNDRTGYGPRQDLLGQDFSIQAGLCGLPQLNFYGNEDGTYTFYINGGDGTAQGQCYPNTASLNCGGEGYYDDRLVCYSYICS